LVEPRNALVKQYERLFELDGVELDFEREALEREPPGSRGADVVPDGLLTVATCGCTAAW
ncbi:hypothetical protein, partial [Streptomyces rochei]|uniref:hypothetical protein n=1 Tax=Streptomyces rochei TaxID=1928 RepID=UPI00348846E2